MRENRAVINQIRLVNGAPLLIDTVTDVLRLACALSDGDVTLVETTKFKSFGRAKRHALMMALDNVIEKTPDKLADVNQYREQWKRLSERLHPHEYPQYPNAQEVFTVARGEKRVRSMAAHVELAFADGNIGKAISLLMTQPGMLIRNVDRILQNASEEEVETLLESVRMVVSRVSGRVILSVREHLQNRVCKGTSRIFANSKGRTWVSEDTRDPFGKEVVKRFSSVFDDDLIRRLPVVRRLVVDPAVLNLAIPLSDKTKASGFHIMPRGSVVPVADGILRFFVYWKQHQERTDYDLSVLLLNEDFQSVGQVSWTNLRDVGGVHSGDLTEAANGASEFIDINLGMVKATYVVPQVNLFAGESFEEVEESFFGFMTRTAEQKGKPFEPRTVRMKSDLRGNGRVALPLVFIKDDGGKWVAKWLHLYLTGRPNFNRVEANRASTSMLVRTIVERKYLRMEYLTERLRDKAESFAWYVDGKEFSEPVVYIGLETPDDLPKDSTVYTLANLQDLTPK
jgi:hypothetical protein